MRLKVGFSNYIPEALATKAEAIVAALTTNAHFPNPLTPTLASIATAAKALRDALATTGPGRQAAIKAAVMPLAAGLTQLGTNLANSEEALDTSGFDRPKARTARTGPPDVPQITRLEDGDHAGEVHAVIKAVPGAETTRAG